MSASLWAGDAAGGRGREGPSAVGLVQHSCMGAPPEISPGLLGGEIGLHSRRKGTVAGAKKAPFFQAVGWVGFRF